LEMWGAGRNLKFLQNFCEELQSGLDITTRRAYL
jgi:hypothetical protein